MLEYGNTAAPDGFTAATGVVPRRFADALAAEPAHVQDRWHARLYFVRPILRLALGAFWVATGLIAALAPRPAVEALLAAAGIGPALAPVALWSTAALDVALGVPLLVQWRVRLAGSLQIVATAGYLAWLTVADPGLWLAPLGPLAKTVPLIVATLVMIAIEDDR
jgi:hypothetical protein